MNKAQLAVAIIAEYEKAFVPGQQVTTGERLAAMLRTINTLGLQARSAKEIADEAIYDARN